VKRTRTKETIQRFFNPSPFLAHQLTPMFLLARNDNKVFRLFHDEGKECDVFFNLLSYHSTIDGSHYKQPLH